MQALKIVLIFCLNFSFSLSCCVTITGQECITLQQIVQFGLSPGEFLPWLHDGPCFMSEGEVRNA